mmetsp:Transcript_12616/g.14472  ORF Transcript_12616/g.14472 Transcript_12616/m.14472 type:complete len:153 (-) Transcript_12616:177-635(-)|eukprot:CAMPEP_0184018432 /NCGR_PEP_ID=MMETSP0954-20121128/8144_1 /TAXON_ID=627963 /ORGANISM="Aplanochytrium sp, Strain PBS07" /LENGTH=152 /DNA_ID=CAMNT_0026299889 /DNA_START=166 /DNA_END=624 /DNA_ORIENTATION=+
MSGSGNSNILYEEDFTILDINPEGKSSPHFKNVSRVVAQGMTFNMSLVIDIQTELFPLKMKDKFNLALASKLNIDDEPDDGTFNQDGKPTLLDKYDYGMHGKVFRYEHEKEHDVAVYISYGGLLMKLVGKQRYLNTVELDNPIYCLIRKSVE